MADCFIFKYGSINNHLKNYLPKPYGLTNYFDYQIGVNVADKTWIDCISSEICVSNGDFNLDTDYLSMNNNYFSIGYNNGLYAYTIYAIVQATEYISGWNSLVASYGKAPQFNLCSNNGNLSIGAGSTSGIINTSIAAYGEWHVCCLSSCENRGELYIDGVKQGNYTGYAYPRYTNDYPINFGYGNIKMIAICSNTTHGSDVILENSLFLKNKYVSEAGA